MMSPQRRTLLKCSFCLFLMGCSVATTIQSDYFKAALTDVQQKCILKTVNYPSSQMYGKSYFCALQCGALDGCTSYCQTSTGCNLLKALFAQKDVVTGGGTNCYMKELNWGQDLADGKTVQISADISTGHPSYKHKEDLTNHGDCPGQKYFYTLWTVAQWISVDLGQEYIVTSVVIGCNPTTSYLLNREIRVGNNPPESLLSNQLFSLLPTSMPSHYVIIVQGTPTRGRYVQIYHPHTEYVTLSYIQVYGQSIDGSTTTSSPEDGSH